MEEESLTKTIIGCAMKVHTALGPGYLESVYEKALAHEVQLVSYLTTTGIEIGLLLNFGAASLQFKRKHRTYRARGPFRQDSQD